MAGQVVRTLLLEGSRPVADQILAMIQEGPGGDITCEWAERIDQGARRLAGGEVDVVVVNLPFRGCQGLDPFDKIRRLAPRVPILAITDRAGKETLMSAHDTGVGDCLVREQLDSRIIRDAIRDLSRISQQVLEQQRSVIEEERLNLLLQVAGATAHKLNQPLMALLGSIDLIRINQGNPDKVARNVDRIEEAGQQIAEIVKKIQMIQRDETKPYLQDSVIIDLDQKLKVLFVIDSDDEFVQMEALVTRYSRVDVARAKGVADGTALLEKERYALILVDSTVANSFGSDLMRYLSENAIDTPVVVMTGDGEEMISSQLAAAGAYDYLPKSQMTAGAFNRVITNVQEKFRLLREVEAIRRQIARQSVTDEQTGLYNRRHFMEVLGREMSRARRYGAFLTIGLIEPEERLLARTDWKDSRSGAVIPILSRLLRREFRTSDIICRYSDKTLAVIFPHTATDALRKRLEVLRKKVAGQPFAYKGKAVSLTIQIGLSPFEPSKDRLPLEYVEQAEDALAMAKQRDLVYIAGIS